MKLIDDAIWWVIRNTCLLLASYAVEHIPSLMTDKDRGTTFLYLGTQKMMYLGDDKYLMI